MKELFLLVHRKIYRKVVYRLLKDWDEERGIKRGSAYSNFDIDVKIDFLAEFSYLLTYRLKSQAFTEEDALAILAEIGAAYGLARSEFMAVLRELETHTGIIVAAGFGRFEFAHLSAQEFLCASFISRSPIPDLLKSYLTEYPAPVAVACALSSQPDLFLHQMLKRHLIDKFKNKEDVFYAIEQGNQLAFDLFGADTSSTLYSFLTRMELERPAFRLSKEFGEALLLIHAFYYRRYTKEIDESIDRIMDWEECKDALQLYLENNKVIAYSLTRHIACLVVDHIFRSIYEEVAGPWPDENEKSKVLPVAIIPKFRAKDGPVYADAFNSEQEANVEEYIKYNVSSTPFCIIESGRHRRRTTGGICEVCGNSVVERFRKKPSVGFRLHR